VLSKDNKILTGFRPDYKRWGLPGGHLEICESFEEGSARELEEETNIKV